MYRERICRWRIAPLFILIVLAATAAQAQTMIDFEDANIPAGEILSAQYGTRGVIFGGGQVAIDSAAHSGQRVVHAVPLGVEVFEVRPLIIRFTGQNITRVKLFASAAVAEPGKLTAFDAENAGNIVAVDGHFVAQNKFTTAFQVTSPTGNIKRVELQFTTTSYVSIDDLEFDGSAGPMPTQPPIVQFTQPINNTDIDVPADAKIDIAGTVTGEGLLSTITVKVIAKQPPEWTAPPLTLVLSLTGSGTTRQFALEGGMTPIALGPVTVTAAAENIAGLKGTATSTVRNLPRSVRDKFGELGGANTFGEFQYGLLKGCAIAVYERGAISGWPAGAIAIRGDIFTKWLSLRGPFNEPGWFGCPKTDEGATIGNATSQTFERGRIYKIPHSMGPPTIAYVPDVFVQVIDKRGGDAGVGLPLADPTDSAGPMQTWLFQRFHRPDDEEWILPSTLEIRGLPPKLWMERQIGKWLKGTGLDEGAFELSAFDREHNKTPATLWESFDCNDDDNKDKFNFLGPCTVLPEPEFPPPITPQNKPDFKNQFCKGGTYIPGSPWGPPEWQPVRGQYDATPVFGYALGGEMATIDNGLTHHTHNGNCPHLGWALSIGSVLSGVPVEAGVNVLEAEYGLTCVSDYEFFVRPLGPQIDTRPQLPNLFSEKHPDRIKAEYEAAYAAEAHNFLGNPINGDLIHMTGRWIVDCGHSTYKTELHPLFSFARMKTVVTETNTFSQHEDNLFGGRPATRVAIWVNGWYPGGETNPIEFAIYPPPRPSATAKLRVVKPVDNGSGGYRAAVDVDLVDSILPFGAATYVKLRFTASRRNNPINMGGEMLFRPGRQYWGIWYLYWAE